MKTLIDTQLSIIVVFTNSDTDEASLDLVDKMAPLGIKMQGVTPFVHIDCAKNHSVKYCTEQKIKRFPTVKMINQDFKYSRPEKWDGDASEYTQEDFLLWIYECRRQIFDMSPKAEALIPVMNEPKVPKPILFYLAKGPQPPISMQRFCIATHGQFKHVLQPGFNEENFADLDGEEIQKLVKPNVDQLVLKTKDGKLHLYKGGDKFEELATWINQLAQEGKLEL
ncbi:Thioredoxin_domain-containing protein [Hexamita inflata]|nr:Thioredoxin domain-containing protein [Hexamita inflata]